MIVRLASLVAVLIFLPVLYSCGNYGEFVALKEDLNEPSIGFTKVPRHQPGADIGFSYTVTKDGEIFAMGGPRAPLGAIYSFEWPAGPWKTISVDAPESGLSSGSIYIADASEAWLVTNSFVLGSSDKGKTWHNFGMPRNSEITRFETIAKSSNGRVFVGGTSGGISPDSVEAVRGMQIFLLERDKREFRLAYESKTLNNIDQSISLNDGSTLFVVDSHYFLSESGAGTDWKLTKLPFPVKSVGASSQSSLWCVDMEGRLLSSTARGTSWEEEKQDNEFRPIWNAVTFTKDHVGMAVGDNGLVALKFGDNPWKVQKIPQSNEGLLDVVAAGRAFAVQSNDNFYVAFVGNDGQFEHGRGK